MTLTAYAKRRGVSAMTVSRAVKKGRLRASVVRDENGDPKIGDPDLADREWESNTDYTDAPQRAPNTPPSAAVQPPPVPTFSKPPDPADDEPRDPPEVQPSDATIATSAAREKHWKAKLAELKYREEAGELIPAADVERRLIETFTSSKTKLLGVPSRARQALPHLSVADIGVLEGLVREALEDLAS
jgi:hypothetical protein